MNRELKITIGILVVVLGLIVYLEMGPSEEQPPYVEPEGLPPVPEEVVDPVEPQPRIDPEPAEDPQGVTEMIPPPVEDAPALVEAPAPPEPEPVLPPVAEPLVVEEDAGSEGVEVAAVIPAEVVIEKGDTLSQISERHLGSVHFQKAILEANPELLPNQLFEGIRLVMPNRDRLEEMANEINKKKLAPGKDSYRIQKGDSLYSISKKIFGTPKRVKDLIEANPQVDPYRLKVGTYLNIPSGN